MLERTTEQIAKIFKNAGDSVTQINTIAGQSSISDTDKEVLKRDVEHLETIKVYKKLDGTTSIWTSENFTAIDAAITSGKSKY